MSDERLAEIRHAIESGYGLTPTNEEALLAEVDRLRATRADASRLDWLDALGDARLIVRDEDGDDQVLWWRMPDRFRARGNTNSLDRPIRDAIDKERLHGQPLAARAALSVQETPPRSTPEGA